MQEAKQLDNRMRDAYSQLRRSAYDMGNSSSPADDTGGVRIRPPSSPSAPAQVHSHARSASREVTLLENGMIVEHVDVRKEEREARERRKRDERRARKSSRSSFIDGTSIISVQSNGQLVDASLRPHSRYSQASSARPTSVLTAPADRPDLPRAYSQASFSDVHSLGSASPRRTRFFGMKNLSAGWRSQDSLAPSGMSGSMVDMQYVNLFLLVFLLLTFFLATALLFKGKRHTVPTNYPVHPSTLIHPVGAKYGPLLNSKTLIYLKQ